MQEKFKKENITDIIYYLRYKKKIDKVNPFNYISYTINDGSLKNIVVVSFKIYLIEGTGTHPFIIDLYDYYNFFRKLKLNKLKTKI